MYNFKFFSSHIKTIKKKQVKLILIYIYLPQYIQNTLFISNI